MRPHLSLDVHDIQASVNFYRRVFGVAPQKQSADYAKFDLLQPALNFSLVSSRERVSHVNHLGIEVTSAEMLADWQRRLQDQGLVEKVEHAVDCCYAKQDKIWFADPDGNQWEVFLVLEQLPVDGPLPPAACCAPTCCVG